MRYFATPRVCEGQLLLLERPYVVLGELAGTLEMTTK